MLEQLLISISPFVVIVAISCTYLFKLYKVPSKWLPLSCVLLTIMLLFTDEGVHTPMITLAKGLVLGISITGGFGVLKEMLKSIGNK